MTIRAVGFDYLGVTAHLGDRCVYDVLSELLGIDSDLILKAYHKHNIGFQQGEINHTQLWTLVAKDLKQQNRLDEIITACLGEVPKIDYAMLKLADRLRAGGYKVGLLANLAVGTPWDKAFYASGADQHFDAVVLAGEIGFSKPDPRIYQAFVERLGIDLNELVFTDDRESSLKGIDYYGVTPILFTGREDLEARLTELGLVFSPPAL
jgi:epoxide hydrolase-like predicted phosphatase